MRLFVAAFVCLCFTLQTAHSRPRCSDIDEKRANNRDVEFPDIEALETDAYQMNVEYTVPDSSQTNYYVEYYDPTYKRGKVEIHRDGKTSNYIYRTESKEAWEITSDTCTLRNSSETPEMLEDFQNEWRHFPDKTEFPSTVGPSAMFKIARAVWVDNSDNMAYMGVYEGEVRGLKAHHFRRCVTDKSYADYFFSTKDDEGAFGTKGAKIYPLRVYFSPEDDSKVSKQQFEIMTFQDLLTPDIQIFELPKGKGCKRSETLEGAPERPDFTNKNLQFRAEVVYRKVDSTGDDRQYTSYYSTIRMALDLQSQHLAYYYTPWVTKGKETEAGAPEYIVFDMKNKYLYKTNQEGNKCEIQRDRSFSPLYVLPEDGGSIQLDDPSILFPNNELIYISKGLSNRGLKVNIYEEIVEGYLINSKDTLKQVDKAIISHSYLQDDEIERTEAAVKNALVQVQLILQRDKNVKVEEIITLNFFGFSTQLWNRRQTFNIANCFRNDDDYLWATIGFNADPSQLEKIKDDVPRIQANILSSITLTTELNPVRIPIVLVDMADGLFVTMLILNKPPVLLDYLEPEEGKCIAGSKDVEGVTNAIQCANDCLEKEDNCWGFAMNGAKCIFGVGEATEERREGCQLYRRYDVNGSFVPSTELMVQSLRREVEDEEIKLVLWDSDGMMVQLQSNSIQITEPGEDDRLFDQIGNTLNPRMRVLKAGYKLKPIGGNPVKNLGRMRYDECQRVCLDFKQCETVSYCLRDSQCLVSDKYGDDLPDDVIAEDNMCNLLTRKYGDHFARSPGNVLVATAQQELDLKSSEECARACLTSKDFQCLSFDHCPTEETKGCKLHTVHYPDSKTREAKQTKATNCGHYFRRFSTEFRRNAEKRSVGAKVAPLTNLTLEECAKSCVEYGRGTCYAYDFCQDGTLLATSCQLLDDVDYKTTYSPICSNFQRTGSALQTEKRPYTNGYAGGMGFLCFIIGLVVGAAVVFTIAYIKVNRR